MSEDELKTFSGLCDSVSKIDTFSDLLKRLRLYSKLSLTIFKNLETCDCDLYEDYLDLFCLLTKKFEIFRNSNKLGESGYYVSLVDIRNEVYYYKAEESISCSFYCGPRTAAYISFPRTFIRNSGNYERRI